MIYNTKTFKTKLDDITDEQYGRSIENCSAEETYEALCRLVMDEADEIRHRQPREGKKVYYFSMEFLIGRLLENYLINLGIREYADEYLSSCGIDINDIFEKEPDPGLGNGGLGRLAACFMDSMASMGIYGDGMGLRYRFGLFKQVIKSGYQLEEPDAWLDNGYPWEKVKNSKDVFVRFGGRVEREYHDGKMFFKHVDYDLVRAVPYDVPLVGHAGKRVNRLHLWDAQPVHDTIDMDAFNDGHYSEAMKERCEIEAITSILYPNDNNGIGKRLRLKQEYFLVAAGIGYIIREFKKKDRPWNELPDYVAIHINDTHPTMCIPELMRVLMDEEGLEWDEAWDITVKTVSFTNHTVMPEALEKWDLHHFRELLPRICMIVEEINRRWKAGLPTGGADWGNLASETSPIWNDTVKMANLSVVGSHSVNGVSTLHSGILTETVFRSFYRLNPEKFNNKTNGISHRRFLIQANPTLTNLIDSRLGKDWQRDMSLISRIKDYAGDEEFLIQLAASKRINKLRLADYVRRNMEIEIDPDSVFDIQVKRMHAYKRQLLFGFKILNLYNELKKNPDFSCNNYTFIIAGKAAQGYEFAKSSIKFINSIADIVNSDPEINQRIKVVFIENFRVSNAQLIYPAADISEQISTAGKEASGTGNMKFMMNGAVTLGTMDGANVEIHDLVGAENIKIFGYSAEETENFYSKGGYSAQAIVEADPRLQLMLDQMINGFFNCCGCDFGNIYDELMKHNDEYFVLGDFASYWDAWLELDALYRDTKRWNEMSTANIAGSGFFSSDRTIKEYAEEIWK